MSTDPASVQPTLELTPRQQKLIVDALNARGVSAKCPRCAPGGMTLVDGLTNFALQGGPNGLVLGGPTVPAAMMACTNCGYIEFHALGALALLDNPAFRGDQP